MSGLSRGVCSAGRSPDTSLPMRQPESHRAREGVPISTCGQLNEALSWGPPGADLAQARDVTGRIVSFKALLEGHRF